MVTYRGRWRLTSRPFAADPATLTMLADGVFANLQGLQLKGVVVRNTWGRSHGHGEFALAISPLSRATLVTFGVVVAARPAPKWCGRRTGAASYARPFGTPILALIPGDHSRSRVRYEMDRLRARGGFYRETSY